MAWTSNAKVIKGYIGTVTLAYAQKLTGTEFPKLCPSCRSGYIVPRMGKFGKFYGCTFFPNCGKTFKVGEINYPDEQELTDG